jgi:hypothetical protein
MDTKRTQTAFRLEQSTLEKLARLADVLSAGNRTRALEILINSADNAIPAQVEFSEEKKVPA